MISIIICSVNESNYKKLKLNIVRTIGEVKYEIIKIENQKKKWNITKAYNYGYKKAIYDNLLFIHEDVKFVNNNWGTIFIQELNKDNIGLLGVAGATYKSCFPSAFWHLPKEKLIVNIIQHYNNKPKKHIKQGDFNCNEIKVIDGVFIGLKKSSTIKFNESIKGFHCYDLGISIDILNKGSKIKVTDKILIEHFSIGTTDKTFIKNYILFHEQYKQLIKNNILTQKALDNYAFDKFLKICLENRFFSFNLLLKSILQSFLTPLNKKFLKMGLVKILKGN